MFKQARQKGYMGMCLSDDAFDDPEALKIGGDLLRQGTGTYYSTLCGPASLYPDTKKFVELFKAKFGHEPHTYAPQAYDATHIMLMAIENCIKASGGNLPSRIDVAKEVRALSGFKGIAGTYKFDWKGDPVTSQVLRAAGHGQQRRHVVPEQGHPVPGHQGPVAVPFRGPRAPDRMLAPSRPSRYAGRSRVHGAGPAPDPNERAGPPAR